MYSSVHRSVQLLSETWNYYSQYAEFTTHSATSRHMKNVNFPTQGRHQSYCIYHVFPLSVGKFLLSKAHSFAWATRTFWSLLCGCSAHHSAYQGAHFEYANAVLYAVISRSTQIHTLMQYPGSRDVDFSPTMQCGNGPLLACHWWRYELWIYRIDKTYKGKQEQHSYPLIAKLALSDLGLVLD